jgi:hypothetical protein
MRTPEGGLRVLAYFPDEGEFRGAGWFLKAISGYSNDADVEFVSEETFEQFVQKERAQALAAPEGVRQRRLAKHRDCRQMIIETVRNIDPARAEVLSATFLSVGEDPEEEKRKTADLLRVLADLHDPVLKYRVALVETLAGIS